MLKTGHFNPLQEVTTQHDAAIISDLDKNLQLPTGYLRAKSGCLTPYCVKAVVRQRNKQTHRWAEILCPLACRI